MADIDLTLLEELDKVQLTWICPITKKTFLATDLAGIAEHKAQLILKAQAQNEKLKIKQAVDTFKKTVFKAQSLSEYTSEVHARLKDIVGVNEPLPIFEARRVTLTYNASTAKALLVIVNYKDLSETVKRFFDILSGTEIKNKSLRYVIPKGAAVICVNATASMFFTRLSGWQNHSDVVKSQSEDDATYLRKIEEVVETRDQLKNTAKQLHELHLQYAEQERKYLKLRAAHLSKRQEMFEG